MAKVSCVQNCGPSLCSVCGPNVNTEDLLFSAREANLVYMDKVYSYNQATACPILASVTTDETWTTELTLESIRSNCGCNDGCGCSEGCGCGNSGCGSGCNCGSQRANIICCNCSTANGCTLTSDATFTITRSYVLVQSLNLNTGVLAAGNVTVDGTAVDSLTQTGNRYTATTENLVGTTSRERCKDLGLPSKHFFLISAPGPWQLVATIVLEGTVNTDGRTCCFQAKFTTPTTPLAVTGASTLAIPKLALPCTVNGVSPTINFSFSGMVHVLNPSITATCTGGTCTLELTASLAVQPQVNAEVVRRTLFCLDACEGMLPCDGTEAAYELDNDDDCTWPPAPACKCGTAPTPANNADICERQPVCNFDDDCDCGCNNCGSGSRTSGSGTSTLPSGFQWTGCNGCSW